MKETIYEIERYEAIEAGEDAHHHFMVWVKQRCKSLGVTQYYLAQVTGIGEGYISELLSGKRKPGLVTAVKIASALKCKLVFEEIK